MALFGGVRSSGPLRSIIASHQRQLHHASLCSTGAVSGLIGGSRRSVDRYRPHTQQQLSPPRQWLAHQASSSSSSSGERATWDAYRHCIVRRYLTQSCRCGVLSYLHIGPQESLHYMHSSTQLMQLYRHQLVCSFSDTSCIIDSQAQTPLLRFLAYFLDNKSYNKLCNILACCDAVDSL